MYRVRRRPQLSQNFLVNRELVSKLVRGSSISPQDTVLEIGPGHGLLTGQLLQVARRVIAVEIDPNLTSHFFTHPNLQLYTADFLTFPLPTSPYKVFSNIPFSITGELVKKLLLAPNPPQESYLIMQSEAAAKFMQHPTANTMLAIMFHPWFAMRIIHHFNQSDFHPQPSVAICLVHISHRQTPLIANQQLYRDFVVHTFTHHKFAKYLPPTEWLKLFTHTNPKLYSGYFASWLKANTAHSQNSLSILVK